MSYKPRRTQCWCASCQDSRNAAGLRESVQPRFAKIRGMLFARSTCSCVSNPGRTATQHCVRRACYNMFPQMCKSRARNESPMFDSVPPLVKTISDGSQPSNAARRSLCQIDSFSRLGRQMLAAGRIANSTSSKAHHYLITAGSSGGWRCYRDK